MTPARQAGGCHGSATLAAILYGLGQLKLTQKRRLFANHLNHPNETAISRVRTHNHHLNNMAHYQLCYRDLGEK